MRQLFGTDGIRGVAGEFPLNRETAFAVGVALGQWVREHHADRQVAIGPDPQVVIGPDRQVVIGIDTRESGPWLAEHVAGGLEREGVRARFAGLITTPGVAHAARNGPFSAGVMISASHNPYQDNGIKIIDHSGFKLPDEQERTLEHGIFAWLKSGEEPKAKPLAADEGLDREYIRYLTGTLPAGLGGMRLVVDAAHGAATVLAPALLEHLGAQVECIHCSPNGRNINLNCGSQHLESLRERVPAAGAKLGVAFDGDADRALFVSHSGKIVDGDAVLLLCALPLHRQGRLREVVATVMSNVGLELALGRHGIGLVRTAVGDKYVLEEMLRRNAPLGGEQSGHIVFRDYATTGDGMLTALRVLEVMRASGLNLDELTAEMETYPQILVNVRVRERKPIEELESVRAAVRRTEAEFGAAGRVLVRFSGTEPLARVMVEGPQRDRVEFNAQAIAAAIRGEIGE